MARSWWSPAAGSTALRERAEELVLRAMQHYGYTHARGFRDDSFLGLPLAKLAEITGLSRPSVYNVQDVYHGLLLKPLRLRPSIGYAMREPRSEPRRLRSRRGHTRSTFPPTNQMSVCHHNQRYELTVMTPRSTVSDVKVLTMPS